MDLKLKNRLSLVTASTAGIGYAIAETLAFEGARVIINGRSQKSVDSAITKLALKRGRRINRFCRRSVYTRSCRAACEKASRCRDIG